MCAGCVAGAIAFGFRTRFFTLLYDADDTGIPDNTKFPLRASSIRHVAVFGVFYSLHLLCVIFAMNMLLRRVSDHASHRSPSQPRLYHRKPLNLPQLLQRRPRPRRRRQQPTVRLEGLRRPVQAVLPGPLSACARHAALRAHRSGVVRDVGVLRGVGWTV
jgi:hypothetical protein